MIKLQAIVLLLETVKCLLVKVAHISRMRRLLSLILDLEGGSVLDVTTILIIEILIVPVGAIEVGLDGVIEADLGGVVAFRALFLRLAIAHLATFANTCQEHVFPAPATIACADSSNCQS